MLEKEKRNKNNLFVCNLCKYLADRKFIVVWIFFVLCALLSLFGLSCHRYGWGICRVGLFIALICFFIFLFHKPLNVVYGLIGKKGHIRTYLILLIVINVFFSLIYQWGIFNNAGITYDINQPHISYGLFADKPNAIKKWTVPGKIERVEIYNQTDSIVSYWNKAGDDHHYQKIEFPYVLKNTFMTSLMQEPSDFFAIASTYNRGVDDFSEDVNRLDQQKSELFHWLLLLQVFISWIFFGVFISILYNKFRYES